MNTDNGTRDRLVTEIDGVAWCITHDSWWVEGETECHECWVMGWTDDCVEVPLYRGQS